MQRAAWVLILRLALASRPCTDEKLLPDAVDLDADGLEINLENVSPYVQTCATIFLQKSFETVAARNTHEHNEDARVALAQTITDLAAPLFQKSHAAVTRVSGRHLVDDADAALVKTLMAPVLSLFVGFALVCRRSDTLAGRILVFFGAQNFMNLYMKSMLSQTVISHERGLFGVQAPFVVTAIQQLIGFVVLVIATAVSQLSPWPYRPRILTTWAEWRTVLICLLCFCFNISLNNLSMSVLDLSANLMIRSCAPLTTLALQLACSKLLALRIKDVNPISFLLVIMGVACGTMVVLGKAHASAANPVASEHISFGVVVCLCSTLAASMELVLVQAIGDNKRLNAMETVLHMGLPASLCLLLPTFYYSHPVEWAGYGKLTDWEILKIVWKFNPVILHLIAFSGVIAVAYNFLLYSIVQALSPTMAAFASNANKVGAIVIATFFGLEALPHGTTGVVVLMGMLGNLVCFTFYGIHESATSQSSKATYEQTHEDAAAADGKKTVRFAPEIINLADKESVAKR